MSYLPTASDLNIAATALEQKACPGAVFELRRRGSVAFDPVHRSDGSRCSTGHLGRDLDKRGVRWNRNLSVATSDRCRDTRSADFPGSRDCSTQQVGVVQISSALVGGSGRSDSSFGVLLAMASNTQLQRAVMQRRRRDTCSSFHCAHMPRWTVQRAARELRR